MPMPCADRLRGSRSTRTAYFAAPPTCTCATPGTVEMRSAIVDSAYSSTCDIGSVDDRNTSCMTESSLGLTFWYDGGAGICDGSCREVRAIIDCTSAAAASMSRLRLNCSVIDVKPSELDELIESSPAMVANCFSSGSATADAIVSGLAPGKLACTRIVESRPPADRSRAAGGTPLHRRPSCRGR